MSDADKKKDRTRGFLFVNIGGGGNMTPEQAAGGNQPNPPKNPALPGGVVNRSPGLLRPKAVVNPKSGEPLVEGRRVDDGQAGFEKPADDLGEGIFGPEPSDNGVGFDVFVCDFRRSAGFRPDTFNVEFGLNAKDLELLDNRVEGAWTLVIESPPDHGGESLTVEKLTLISAEVITKNRAQGPAGPELNADVAPITVRGTFTDVRAFWNRPLFTGDCNVKLAPELQRAQTADGFDPDSVNPETGKPWTVAEKLSDGIRRLYGVRFFNGPDRPFGPDDVYDKLQKKEWPQREFGTGTPVVSAFEKVAQELGLVFGLSVSNVPHFDFLTEPSEYFEANGYTPESDKQEPYGIDDGASMETHSQPTKVRFFPGKVVKQTLLTEWEPVVDSPDTDDSLKQKEGELKPIEQAWQEWFPDGDLQPAGHLAYEARAGLKDKLAREPSTESPVLRKQGGSQLAIIAKIREKRAQALKQSAFRVFRLKYTDEQIKDIASRERAARKANALLLKEQLLRSEETPPHRKTPPSFKIEIERPLNTASHLAELLTIPMDQADVEKLLPPNSGVTNVTVRADYALVRRVDWQEGVEKAVDDATKHFRRFEGFVDYVSGTQKERVKFLAAQQAANGLFLKDPYACVRGLPFAPESEEAFTTDSLQHALKNYLPGVKNGVTGKDIHKWFPGWGETLIALFEVIQLPPTVMDGGDGGIGLGEVQSFELDFEIPFRVREKPLQCWVPMPGGDATQFVEKLDLKAGVVRFTIPMGLPEANQQIISLLKSLRAELDRALKELREPKKILRPEGQRTITNDRSVAIVTLLRERVNALIDIGTLNLRILESVQGTFREFLDAAVNLIGKGEATKDPEPLAQMMTLVEAYAAQVCAFPVPAVHPVAPGKGQLVKRLASMLKSPALERTAPDRENEAMQREAGLTPEIDAKLSRIMDLITGREGVPGLKRPVVDPGGQVVEEVSD